MLLTSRLDFTRYEQQGIDNHIISGLEGPLGVSAGTLPITSTYTPISITGASSPNLEHALAGANITIITNDPKQLRLDTNMDAMSPLTNASSPRSPGSPWIGGTGLGTAALGKSGRVIEKMMAENDKLRREIKTEIMKREELLRTVNTQKPKLEALQADNTRLTNIKVIDDNMLERRDRKIEELKAELEAERLKRSAAEKRAIEAEQQKEMSQDATRKELQQEREKARHATVHAEILQTSHQQLSREYRQRISTTNKAVRDLNHDKEGDRKRLARLDIVCNQMRQEGERMRKLHNDLTSVWHRFQTQKNDEVERLNSNAQKTLNSIDKRERENVRLGEDMERVLTRMKWVIRMDGVDKGHDSPPPSGDEMEENSKAPLVPTGPLTKAPTQELPQLPKELSLPKLAQLPKELSLPKLVQAPPPGMF